MSLISVVTPCYNEEGNIEEIYRQVKSVFEKLGKYSYEHIFIDNASKDNTGQILKDIAKKDKNVKIIVNAKNFGILRSGNYGFLQAYGDAVITIVADLQDPPSMIEDFINKWEEGYKIVIAVKKKSREAPLMFWIRRFYYNLISRISEMEHIKNFTGFGLYDKSFVDVLRKLEDPYPYFRGLVAELGQDRFEFEYEQPARKKGKTKNNFYVLYDTAMLGITNQSKVPLRLAAMLGFALAFLNIVIAFFYFIYKLLYWDNFSVGMAPLVIGLFFFSSVQLFFIGILGEYLGAIHTQVLKRPLVVEKERINFD